MALVLLNLMGAQRCAKRQGREARHRRSVHEHRRKESVTVGDSLRPRRRGYIGLLTTEEVTPMKTTTIRVPLRSFA